MKEVGTISDSLRAWDFAHALQSVSVQTWAVNSRDAENQLIHCREDGLFCHLWGYACPDKSQRNKVCYFHGSDAKWHRISQLTLMWLHSSLLCEGPLHPYHFWEQPLRSSSIYPGSSQSSASWHGPNLHQE